MKGGRNIMIRASAGSGKTYRLTSRFVELLASGSAPERIVALTFTRKAAGEFFDEILNKLAEAARDPEAAAKLAGEIDRLDFRRGDFLRLLRTVVDAMPRLRLGTLDGFFARIVRSFPFELGLTGDFELLEEHQAGLERRRALGRLFAGAAEATEARRAFVEAFKRATFGRDEKRLSRQLDRFLDDCEDLYLAAPDAEVWGNRARIWPEGSRWLKGSPPDAAVASAALRAWVERSAPDEKSRGRWESFIALALAWRPGSTIQDPLEYGLEKALESWEGLEDGRSEIKFDKKVQNLDATARAAYADLVRLVYRGLLEQVLASTRGIRDILAGYEAEYEIAVRRAGRLTFEDVRRVLEPADLTGTADAAGGERLYLDYRIDGGIDHWLLDEFQDTSFGQWRILHNLVDEAVQDPRRSFFCVGDVKQSIFAWRQGDPRLFSDILARYNGAVAGTIAEGRLDQSWRSGPPLIAMINAVFGAADAIERLLPGRAASDWNAAWTEHTTARPDRSGQAALLHADDEDGCRAVALALLREVRPHERGLTCAVLVQTNKAAVEVADYLRREGGLPAVAASDNHPCIDNPVGSALLSLFQTAAHPGDRLAWEHIRMTPLRGLLETDGLDDPDALSRRVLGQVHAEGFERTAEAWLVRLDSTIPAGDRFSRERARRFVEAAALFDRSASRDIDQFRDFMAKHVIRDAESAGTIRILTIHKSKGLGFDVVILPDLGGKKLLQAREGFAVKRRDDRSIEWILDPPKQLFCDHDPVLADHFASAEADGGYEKLSLFYVALTRAKRALYAIIEPPSEKSKSANFPRHLSETLGKTPQPIRVGALELTGAWSNGDPAWLSSLPPVEPPAPPPAIPPLDPSIVAAVPRLRSRRPSADRSAPQAASRLFRAESSTSFGSEVHDLLAKIDWFTAGDPPPASWEDADRPAEAEARACLGAPELAPVWSRPGPDAEVWRERPFEVVLDGTWITGRFDRVIVRRGPDGRATAATVCDFKTDWLPPDADLAAEAGRHASQMTWYRRSAAALTGLPVEAIACEVVFTRARRSVRL